MSWRAVASVEPSFDIDDLEGAERSARRLDLRHERGDVAGLVLDRHDDGEPRRGAGRHGHASFP